MTAERDFDRIARAWLEPGPNDAPDRAIAAALLAIESTPQVRRSLRWPTWRPNAMTRLPVLVALGGALLLLIGGLLVGGGTPPVPSPAPVSPGPSPTTNAYASPRPLPPALVGGWVAPARGVASLEDGPVAVIFFGGLDGNPRTPDFGVDRPGFLPIQPSDVVETAPGTIQLTSTATSGLCTFEDVGSYRWSIDEAEPWLTLEAIDDECGARAEILPGRWMRSLAHDSRGGSGIATTLSPFLQFDLPAGTYIGGGSAERDTMLIDSQDGRFTFKAWKDPDGFADTCDPNVGRIDLAPGIDPFVEYVTNDSGLVVTGSEETTIDGRRAVRLAVGTDPALAPGCGPEGSVLQWISNAQPTGDWHLLHGLTDVVLVTEVGDATLVMEVLEADGPSGDLETNYVVAQDVVDSIRFLDALPTPPAG